MKRQKTDRQLIILLAMTLTTLASWVGFEVYRAYTEVPVPEVLQRHLQPLDPRLDTSTLDQLEQRQP